MAGPFDGLEPQEVWAHFLAFTTIPRPSGQESQMVRYIRKISDSKGFQSIIDAAGNLRVRVPATVGLEGKPTVVLQGHLDMVCSRDGDAGEYDPSIGRMRVFRAKEQGGDVVEDPHGEWIKAYRTTLGADNGIGVASILSVATDSSVTHGPLDLLFTVQEEAGLIGAANLDPAIVDGRLLLNVDSEEEGVFTIGSAGGRETSIIWVRPTSFAAGHAAVYKVTLSGLLGGHSGMDIHRGRLNGIRGLVRLLHIASQAVPIQIASIEGGDRSNAIPREAIGIIAIDPNDNDALSAAVEKGRRELQVQYNSIEPGIKITLEVLNQYHGSLISPNDTIRLLELLRSLPSGIVAMSQDLPGLVETSNNLGVVKTGAATIDITCNSRSSVSVALDDITATLVAIGGLADAAVVPGSAYPGWRPDPNAPTLAVLKTAYKGLFGTDPQVAAVHAGLECGVLNGKIQELDMVSFGPTIVGAHSTRERVHIASVGRFYKLLVAVIAALAK